MTSPIGQLSCLESPHLDETPGTCIFESVWSHIDSAMLLFNLTEDRLLWQNQAAEKLLRSLDPYPDYQTLRSLLVPDPSIYTTGQQVRRLQETRVGATVLGFSIYRTSPSHFVALLRDITEQRRLESIAESANLMENIGYVFGGIRHELGNPINTIKMTLSVLRKNLDTLSPSGVIEHLDRTLDELTRVEYLLTNLRGFSIYDAPQLTTVDLMDALQHFTHLVAEDMATRAIDLSVGVDEEARWALADERCLQQVLLNLVTNSADALEGRTSPRIAITAEAHCNQVVLSVTDNGVGIAESQMPHLFRPFRTTKPKGTGLGMVIVKKMLTAMGAAIEVTSKVDEGTTMTLILPRARFDEAADCRDRPVRSQGGAA